MKKNNKGFTLAELLIVVAVIAVLVAVAIPTFANQLEKSRQAVDISNLRQAFAAARLAEQSQMIGGTKMNVDTMDATMPFYRAAATATGTEGGLKITTLYNAKTGEFVYPAIQAAPGDTGAKSAACITAGATEMKAKSTTVVADKSKLNSNIVYGDTSNTLTPSDSTNKSLIVVTFVTTTPTAATTDKAGGFSWKLDKVQFTSVAVS